MSNAILAKMAVEISANNAKFGAALSKSQRDLSGFTQSITRMAGALGAAFGVREIARFRLEVSKLAGQAEAVGIAFDRLPNSVRLMSELSKATGGTVSQLELMKRAVQASNFDISLEALPRLLEFATIRAQQTGQSVDYLVDSIVTGIGRKSKLILDNLGISAVQLDKALGGVSIAAADVGQVAEAVGKIASENLKNMAAFSENADVKIQRLSASWDDLKVAIGAAANNSDVLVTSLNVATKLLRVAAGDQLQEGINNLMASSLKDRERLNRLAASGADISLKWQDLLARGYVSTEYAAKRVAKVLTEIQELQKNMALAREATALGVDPTTGVPTSGLKALDPSMITKQVVSLDSLKAKLKELNEQFAKIDVTDKAKLKNTADQIIATNKQIDAIENLLKVQEKQIALSRAGMAAMKEGGLQSKSKTFGEEYTRITGQKGERNDLGAAIPVDLDRMKATADRMIDMRNASLSATTDMTQHWIDFSGAISGAITNIADGIGGAISGIEDFGSGIIKAFAGFAGQFGQMLIASGIAALSLQKLIKNPAAAIAAGVALVAVAGAAQASLSKAHSGLMSGGGGAPGRLPSESSTANSGRSRIVGYDLLIVDDKNDYRRSRLG